MKSGSRVIGAAHIYRGDSSMTDIRRNIERLPILNPYCFTHDYMILNIFIKINYLYLSPLMHIYLKGFKVKQTLHRGVRKQ